MLENISQSTDDGYEKYLKSPDLAYKALTQGLLNDEYIKLYKEQHPEDIAKIEAFLHPEISTESVKQKVEEDLKNIETYSEKITDIPDRQEKQIVELGGDPAIIEEKLKPEFNVLKSIRDSALNKFTKVAATLTALVTFNNVKSEDLNINKKDLEQVVTKSSKYPQLLERYVRDEKGELHFLGYEDKKGITINPEKENTTNRNDLTDLEKMAKTTKEI